jgi:hypothetical protein
MMGIPDDERLILRDGWLEKYKGNTGLKQFKQHGEVGSVSPVDVDKEPNRMKYILMGFEPCNVYNMDEMGLFYAYDIHSPPHAVISCVF